MDFLAALAAEEAKIWIFWGDDVSLTIKKETDQIIQVDVRNVGESDFVTLSFVYAKCSRNQRLQLWSELKDQAAAQQGPWFVVGDFNIVADLSEREGGITDVRPAMNDFRDAIQTAGLMDAGFEGSPYTWTNGRIKERLDRALHNCQWLSNFRTTTVCHLNATGSDHNPLLCHSFDATHKGPRAFRFQNMWSNHPNFQNLVRQVWGTDLGGRGMIKMVKKLKHLKQALKLWNRQTFGNIHNHVREHEELVQRQEMLCDSSGNVQDRMELNRLRAMLKFHLNNEEIFLKQKSTIKWLKAGDKNSNSKFFHAITKRKHAKLSISKITDQDGLDIIDRDGIRQSGVDYFQKMLANDPSQRVVRNFTPLTTIPRLITENINCTLNRKPEEKEIKETIDSMETDSSAGPDGFNTFFYKKCWTIIKEDVVEAIGEFFEGGPIPRGVTSTMLALIPKTQNPSGWKDYRPISLCNVLNKIITKIMASRLSDVLPLIISQTQSGFVKGRSIVDNVLLAQEMVYALDNKTRGGNVIIKLDMEKAYDRVDWDFLFAMLEKFGFNDLWIEKVRKCVTNCFFSVLINGESSGYFKGGRGLRQGDPLSPALFIIMAEYLSRQLQELCESDPGSRYRVRGTVLDFNNLSFADDIVIFTNGQKSNLLKVRRILDNYEQLSGQRVNRTKSMCIWPSQSATQRKQMAATKFGYRNGDLPITYLGCPLFKGRRKTFLFDELIKKIKDKVEGWASKLLSTGGRLVLLKHVLTSMPMYLLQMLNPSKQVLKDIEKILAKFWWGSTAEKRGFHWKKWKELCKPTDEGGLGIRRTAEMNLAFGYKLWWKLREGESLWAKFMAKCYCRNAHPSQANRGTYASPTWRWLVSIRNDAEKYIKWKLGKGEISFWWDNWLNGEVLGNIYPGEANQKRVMDYRQNNLWNLEETELGINHKAKIRTVEEVDWDRPDEIRWTLSKTGKFSTCSAWRQTRPASPKMVTYQVIWNKFIPTKISILVWRIVNRILPTDDVLKGRGINLASKCGCCKSGSEESLTHLFMHGEMAAKVWNLVGEDLGRAPRRCEEINQFILGWWLISPNSKITHVSMILPILTFWEIWLQRNEIKRNGGRPNAIRLYENVKTKLRDISTATPFERKQVIGNELLVRKLQLNVKCRR